MKFRPDGFFGNSTFNSYWAATKIKGKFSLSVSVNAALSILVFGCYVALKCLVHFRYICIASEEKKKRKKMSAEIIHSKFTQDLVSFSLNGFSKSKVNNNTQQDEKIKHQLTPFDRSEPQLYCHCTLIYISKTLSKCIHTFSETDVFCSSFATLSILGRVSWPIEAVTIELSIVLHRLPSPCLHRRTLAYTRVRSVLY